ncbi:MAG: hypothetical protein ACKVP4_08555 [Hyphomicrobium sp.]
MSSKLPKYVAPSPYIPFIRRFTDERAADLRDLQALHASVTADFRRSQWSSAFEPFCKLTARTISEGVDDEIPEACSNALVDCLVSVLQLETTIFETADVKDWAALSLREHVDLRRYLRAQQHFLANDERVGDLLLQSTAAILAGVAASLSVPDGKSAFAAVPLYAYLDVNDVVDRIIGTLSKAANQEAGLFATINEAIYCNICRASGLVPYADQKKPFITAADSTLPPHELIDAYLGGTAFADLLLAPLPFSIPARSFHEHGFLFAKSGHGKSQTLRAIFASLLKEDCAVFLIDGNGHLIEGIDKIAEIKDRLVILDPADVPALNFYNLHGASREKQMELFFYLFKAIEQGLTERQATMIAYLVDFMRVIPNSTLDTLREVCDAKTLPYSQHLKDAPPITQDFFKNQFLSADQLVRQTKSQIANRLYSLCRNQMFIAMFNAPDNKFDAFRAMQEKKIVVVNTDRNALGDHGSAVFGRFILAQCLAAAFQRPKAERHLALIICDEAKTYLDDQSQKILSDARAYGLGLLLATQHPDQLQDGVRKEVINNTSIKLAGPCAYSVVAQIHRDMRCEADFILGMKKRDFSHADWACYVEGLTPNAIRVAFPFGVIDKLPQLTDAEHAALRARNKATYCTTAPLRATPPQAAPDAPGLGEWRRPS